MKNKLIVSFLFAGLACALLTGCNKKQEPEAKIMDSKEVAEAVEEVSELIKDTSYDFKTGAYCMEYEEEYADGVVTFKSYLYFEDGGKGFVIFQDDVPMTYTNDTITDENGGKYTYKMTDADTIELTRDGLTEKYSYVGKELPKDALDEMSHFLDGKLKINNPDAAYSFEYVITSDVISFYSTSSAVEYAAEGEDLENMKAAYIEMADYTVPVLLVKTPDAPKEVGFEHVLQYSNEKIYNVIGLDKIEEIYPNAAVIAASQEDNGEKTTYYYKPDSNLELYAFASVTTSDGSSCSYKSFDEQGVIQEISEDEFNGIVKDAVGEDTAIETIEWKSLDKAI